MRTGPVKPIGHRHGAWRRPGDTSREALDDRRARRRAADARAAPRRLDDVLGVRRGRDKGAPTSPRGPPRAGAAHSWPGTCQGAILRSRDRSRPVSPTPMIISTTIGTKSRSVRKVLAYCTIMYPSPVIVV